MDNPKCAVCGEILSKRGKTFTGEQMWRCPQLECHASGTLAQIEERGRRHRESLRLQFSQILRAYRERQRGVE